MAFNLSVVKININTSKINHRRTGGFSIHHGVYLLIILRAQAVSLAYNWILQNVVMSTCIHVHTVAVLIFNYY